MAFLTLALQGASTAMGIMGAVNQGEADSFAALVRGENQARQFDAQADADTFNAKVSRQLAEGEREQAVAEAGDYRRTNRAAASARRARQAASGLALDGSPLLVDEAIFSEIDFGASRIGYAGDLAAFRLEQQGELLDKSAADNRESARYSRETGQLSSDNIKKASVNNAIGAGIKGLTGISTTLSTRGTPNWGTGRTSTTSGDWTPTGGWANW